MQCEIARRDALAIEKRIKSAGFPEFKTLKTFDFKDIDTPKSVTRQFFTGCDFIDSKFNIFMYGPPGVGKTHLSIALGLEACKRMYRVKFYRMTDLIQVLRQAELSNDAKFYKTIAKTNLIIIDEFGFPPQSPDTVRLFFDFVSNSCYEKKSLIMTSNRTVAEWLSDFEGTHDEKMAQATIDRIVQDSFLFNFKGQSRRVSTSKLSDTAG
jgi:DNA replication protein DnaC